MAQNEEEIIKRLKRKKWEWEFLISGEGVGVPGVSFSITFFIGKYDCINKELEYVNCAHPSALLYNEHRVYELKSYIPGLGMLDELPPFETQSITMTTNSILTCYTDGISELENENGEPFGVHRIKKSLRNFGKVELEGLVEHVTKDLQSFAENSKVTDDIAALSILFKV